MIINFQDDSLEEDNEGSLSASPSDAEIDGSIEEGSIEAGRRFLAEALDLGFLASIWKNRSPPSKPVSKLNLLMARIITSYSVIDFV